MNVVRALQPFARRPGFGDQHSQPAPPCVELAPQLRHWRIRFKTKRQQPPGRLNIAVLRKEVGTEQHFILRLVASDFLEHFAHVHRDRLVIEREEIAQGRDPVAPGFDQLLLQQGDRRGIVVAQEPHDRILLEHLSLLRF
jgi:hypothetical protein